jgi:hypothetical protein
MMSQLLKTLFSLALLAVLGTNEAQTPDRYDTLFTRSDSMILVPRYDSIKQLEEANQKADSIMIDLNLIKSILVDTTKIK